MKRYRSKYTKKIISIMLTVVIIFTITGCNKSGYINVDEIPETFIIEQDENSPGIKAGFKPVYTKYYYTTLTDKQKEIYLNIYYTVEEMYTGNVRLAKGVTTDDLTTATSAYFADNPQHFWVAESMELCWTATDNLGIGFTKFFNGIFSLFPGVEKKTDYTEFTTAYCKMSYIYDSKEEKDKAQEELNNAISEALAGLDPGMSEFDRELYLHDWLTERCTYDDEAFQQFVNEGTVGDRINCHTAYGAIVEKNATCAGYARAMQLLLGEAGIESRFITGIRNDETAGSAVAHAWNVVFFNGTPYHLDATWNDKDLWGIKSGAYVPVTGDEKNYELIGNRTEHKYFNVSEEVISKDHWGFTPQYANGTTANYFVYKQLNFTDPNAAVKDATTNELIRMSERNDRFIEIYAGLNKNEQKKYLNYLVNENEGMIYECLKSANDALGEKFYREDFVYYGLDENSGIISVYVMPNHSY